MLFLNALPQRLDSGATPTFAGILTGDGSAAAPSVSFTNGPATGLYRISSSIMGVAVSGAAAMSFQRDASNGYLVGVGNGQLSLGFTGAVGLVAAGTNQSVTLTPSGTAPILLQGPTTVSGLILANGGYQAASGQDTQIGRAVTNGTLRLLDSSGSVANVFAGQSGAVTSSSRFVKAVTAISNAVATAVLTVTIPNAAHSAQLLVRLTGSLGAGGAIGANEASAGIVYSLTIARTAGVNAVVTASTAFGSAAAAVAGAATCTITAAASAISGAVGASNTFTVNVTISRGSGSSTNHTCQVVAEIDNANATGITVA